MHVPIFWHFLSELSIVSLYLFVKQGQHKLETVVLPFPPFHLLGIETQVLCSVDSATIEYDIRANQVTLDWESFQLLGVSIRDFFLHNIYSLRFCPIVCCYCTLFFLGNFDISVLQVPFFFQIFDWCGRWHLLRHVVFWNKWGSERICTGAASNAPSGGKLYTVTH